MKIFRKILTTPDFDRDLRRLLKRYPSLNEDFEEFVQTQLNLTHKLHCDNQGVFRITGTARSYPPCYIAKKFTCKSLFGTGVRSGIRVVYVYWEKRDEIHFIEIFHKSNKEIHDKKRLESYLSKHV